MPSQSSPMLERARRQTFRSENELQDALDVLIEREKRLGKESVYERLKRFRRDIEDWVDEDGKRKYSRGAFFGAIADAATVHPYEDRPKRHPTLLTVFDAPSESALKAPFYASYTGQEYAGRLIENGGDVYENPLVDLFPLTTISNADASKTAESSQLDSLIEAYGFVDGIWSIRGSEALRHIHPGQRISKAFFADTERSSLFHNHPALKIRRPEADAILSVQQEIESVVLTSVDSQQPSVRYPDAFRVTMRSEEVVELLRAEGTRLGGKWQTGSNKFSVLFDETAEDYRRICQLEAELVGKREMTRNLKDQRGRSNPIKTIYSNLPIVKLRCQCAVCETRPIEERAVRRLEDNLLYQCEDGSRIASLRLSGTCPRSRLAHSRWRPFSGLPAGVGYMSSSGLQSKMKGLDEAQRKAKAVDSKARAMRKKGRKNERRKNAKELFRQLEKRSSRSPPTDDSTEVPVAGPSREREGMIQVDEEKTATDSDLDMHDTHDFDDDDGNLDGDFGDDGAPRIIYLDEEDDET